MSSILLLSFLSSCTKEDSVFTDGGSAGIVELELPARTTSTVYAVKSLSFTAQEEVDFPVSINYTGVNGTPSDVKIAVEVNNSAVTTYNAASNTSYTPLPNELYTATSNEVTIPRGTKTGIFLIKLKTGSFDFTKSYALGITIRSTSSGTVSGNYGTGIYRVTAKNNYEGSYRVTGWFFHPTAGRAINAVKTLSTTGKESVSAPLGDLSGYAIEFSINGSKLEAYKPLGSTPTGLNSGFFTADQPGVSPTWINNPVSADAPGKGPWVVSTYNNSYDETAKTFYLAYGYVASGGSGQSSWSRQIYEKWVKQ